MMSLETLGTFLGWCTVINIVILAVVAIAVTGMRGTLVKIHSGMFGLAEADLLRMYLNYMGNYKIAVFMLNLVPYIAVKAML